MRPFAWEVDFVFGIHLSQFIVMEMTSARDRPEILLKAWKNRKVTSGRCNPDIQR